MAGAERDQRVERMLAAWSADARIEERLGGGYRNQVWAVRIGRGRYAARLSSRPGAALDWEIDLLQYLRAAEMAAPEVLATRDGRFRVEGLVLFGWIEGRPPSSLREWRLVVEELVRLHAQRDLAAPSTRCAAARDRAEVATGLWGDRFTPWATLLTTMEGAGTARAPKLNASIEQLRY